MLGELPTESWLSIAVRTAARPEFKPALSEVRIQAGRLAGLCGTDPMVMTSTN